MAFLPIIVSLTSFVVGLADGRHYLYIDCFQDESRVVRVYDLNASEVRCRIGSDGRIENLSGKDNKQ